MDSLSLAELFWIVLVLAGVAAEVLERAARYRAARAPVRTARPGDDAPVAALAHRV